MQAVLQHARVLHGGHHVYKSRDACVDVLRRVQSCQPPWWTPRCSAFVRHVAELDDAACRGHTTRAPQPQQGVTTRACVVLVEGLDGTGKTCTAQALAAKLRGVVVTTPEAQWADVRQCFREQHEAIARAFYSAANYVGAARIAHLVAAAAAATREGEASSSSSLLTTTTQIPAFVVVDRWWCSTCAMALANVHTLATLPPPGHAVYTWPEDLRVCDVGVLLTVDEAVRVERIRRRAPADVEEQRLAAQQSMRATATEAYMRTRQLSCVQAPNYRASVNAILQLLQQRGVQHSAVPYTADESMPRTVHAVDDAPLRRLLPAAVAVMGALCLWRLSRRCVLVVPPQCVAVVYDPRRLRVLYTSAAADAADVRTVAHKTTTTTTTATSVIDYANNVTSSSPAGVVAAPHGVSAGSGGDDDAVAVSSSSSSSPLLLPRRDKSSRDGGSRSATRTLLARLLVRRGGALVLTPPPSLCGVFLLPRSVLAGLGEAVACTVTDVHVSDGVVHLVLTVRYTVLLSQLDRYLAAVGAQAPNAVIARAVAHVARVCAAAVSVGTLLSRSRREAVFVPSFTQHLSTRLMSHAALCVSGVTLEHVDLADAS